MNGESVRRWFGVELVAGGVGERVVSGLGGGMAMVLVWWVSRWVVPAGGGLAVVASMGASAVLLFAVPHGPLSQPWPVVGGHVISAVVGVTCARWIGVPEVAAAVAVGLAIAGMQAGRCIHPPGGATAFTAVMGGVAVRDLGYWYVVMPVLMNAVVMVVLAVVINWGFRWRRYPAGLGAGVGKAGGVVPSHEELEAAIRSIDTFVDISEDDLVRLMGVLGGGMGDRKRRSG